MTTESSKNGAWQITTPRVDVSGHAYDMRQHQFRCLLLTACCL